MVKHLRIQQLLLAFVLGLVLSLMFGQVQKAYPHDFYSDGKNPRTGRGCCGGDDCMALDYSQFKEDRDEFVVSIPPGFLIGVPQGGVFHFPKAEAMPTPRWKKGETGYHACIVGKDPRCFYYPPST